MKSVCLRDFKAVFNKLSGDAIDIILSFSFFNLINDFSIHFYSFNQCL